MTDDAGKTAFLSGFPVSREIRAKLEMFASLVEEHGRTQNLVAVSTLPSFWHRHIFDSAQLLKLAPADARRWIDVGSGAGLPGLVLAILSGAAFTLVEPRRLRADFLRLATARLGLDDRVTVLQSTIDRVSPGPFDVITARAFSSLLKTVEAADHLAGPKSTWLLHKGRNAAAEVAEARLVWEGDFTLTPSETDPAAAIVKLSRVRRRTNS